MSTFTDQADLAGTTVFPFVTYAVSGIGDVGDDYRAALSASEVRTGLAVLGEIVTGSGREVDRWLTANGLP